MTGFFSYDSNQEPVNSKYPLSEFSMTIGNYTFSHDPRSGEQASFSISNAYLHGLTYFMHSRSPQFTGVVNMNGMPTTFDEADWRGFGLFLDFGSLDTHGISNTLPTRDSFTDIAEFEHKRMFDIGIDDSPGFWVTGGITSMTAIPEPATLVLLGLGALSVVRKRKSYN